jgi:hypothetical protein
MKRARNATGASGEAAGVRHPRLLAMLVELQVVLVRLLVRLRHAWLQPWIVLKHFWGGFFHLCKWHEWADTTSHPAA